MSEYLEGQLSTKKIMILDERKRKEGRKGKGRGRGRGKEVMGYVLRKRLARIQAL